MPDGGVRHQAFGLGWWNEPFRLDELPGRSADDLPTERSGCVGRAKSMCRWSADDVQAKLSEEDV